MFLPTSFIFLLRFKRKHKIEIPDAAPVGQFPRATKHFINVNLSLKNKPLAQSFLINPVKETD